MSPDAEQRVKRLSGRIGIACWLVIIPFKMARHLDLAFHPALVGLAPSFFGPLGLLLVILSGEHRFPRVTVARATLIAGSIALALEFAQALPLVRRIYTFDWLDVAVTLAGVAAALVISAGLRRPRRTTEAPMG